MTDLHLPSRFARFSLARTPCLSSRTLSKVIDAIVRGKPKSASNVLQSDEVTFVSLWFCPPPRSMEWRHNRWAWPGAETPPTLSVGMDAGNFCPQYCEAFLGLTHDVAHGGASTVSLYWQGHSYFSASVYNGNLVVSAGGELGLQRAIWQREEFQKFVEVRGDPNKFGLAGRSESYKAGTNYRPDARQATFNASVRIVGLGDELTPIGLVAAIYEQFKDSRKLDELFIGSGVHEQSLLEFSKRYAKSPLPIVTNSVFWQYPPGFDPVTNTVKRRSLGVPNRLPIIVDYGPFMQRAPRFQVDVIHESDGVYVEILSTRGRKYIERKWREAGIDVDLAFWPKEEDFHLRWN